MSPAMLKPKCQLPPFDVHRLFLAEARQAALYEDEVAHLLRPLCGIGIGDVSAQVMSDQCDAQEA